MDLCPVCLEVGVEPCTECGRLYHSKCIGRLLEHGFDSCQCCFIAFSPSLHVKAAEYVVEIDNNSPASQMQLAAALTSARRGAEALRILQSLQTNTVFSEPMLKGTLDIEMGRAYLNLAQPKRATRELLSALIVSRGRGLPLSVLQLRAMALLTRAYFEQEDYDMVHIIAGAAMCQVHRMHHTDAMNILRVVADTYKVQKETSKYRRTLEALHAVVTEESRDALAKATVAAELGIVEHKLGVRSAERLKPAIRTLRKHKHTLTEPACSAFQEQVRPCKRVLRKTHPEDMG